MKQPALGNKIAALRNKKSMTQKEVADLCHVDIRTIQRIESGEVTPRMYTLKLLANVLGCNVDDLNENPGDIDKRLHKQLRLSYFMGILFVLNGIPLFLI